MEKRNILIGLLALVICVFGWNCFGCKHEKTITRLVNDSDFSKDGMVEVICTKCGDVLHTEMINAGGDRQ